VTVVGTSNLFRSSERTGLFDQYKTSAGLVQVTQLTAISQGFSLRLPGSASKSAQNIEFCSGLACTDKDSVLSPADYGL